MEASTMRLLLLRFLLPVMILAGCPRRVGAVAHLWFGKDSHRGGDPCPGYHHQP